MKALRTNGDRVTKGVRVLAGAQVLELLVLAIAFFGQRTDVLVLALFCTGLSGGIAVPLAIALTTQRVVLQDTATANG